MEPHNSLDSLLRMTEALLRLRTPFAYTRRMLVYSGSILTTAQAADHILFGAGG